MKKLEITENGIIAPTETEIRDELLAKLNEALGGDMSRELTTPQGQIATSLAYSINQSNNNIKYLFNQFNPNFATGSAQDALAALYFIERMPARSTSVTAKCTGIAGTVIPKGSIAQDDNGNLYESQSDAVIGDNGQVNVIFANQIPGEMPCPAGALNTIYRQVVGWTSVVNEASGALGADEESRHAFEQRRRDSVALNSQNQNISIQASVLSTPGVFDAFVYSNDTGASILYGDTRYEIPAHTLLISVAGGNDNEVAEAIFNKKNPGCGMTGNTSITIELKEGYSEPYPRYNITFLRPKPIDVIFKVEIFRDENLPPDIKSQVKRAIIDIFTGKKGNSRARIGSRINIGRYYGDISSISEFVNIESIQVRKSNGSYASYIEMGVDELPVISADNIEVNL